MRDAHAKILLLALVVLALPRPARSNGILYNSLDGSLLSAVSVTDSGPLYASFSTDWPFYLSEVQLSLVRSNPATTGSIKSYLFANDPSFDMPGDSLAYLGTLADSSVLDTPAVYTFSASWYPLDSHTRYWIGIVSQDGSGIQWTTTLDFSGIGVALEYVADKGGRYRVAVDALGNPFRMRLTDNVPGAVPEPRSVSMGLLGLVALWGLRHRLSSNHRGASKSEAVAASESARGPRPQSPNTRNT